MKLKRSIENGQVIFRNSDTNEIIKTESVKSNQSSSQEIIPTHTSILGSIITIVGVIIFLISIILMVFGLNSSLIGIATLPLGLGSFISSIILFAIAELVQNSQYQTKLLIKILEKGLSKQIN